MNYQYLHYDFFTTCRKRKINKTSMLLLIYLRGLYSIACGVDIAKVQHRLGHESLKETDRYAMAINEPIANDIKKVFMGDKGELRNG